MVSIASPMTVSHRQYPDIITVRNTAVVGVVNSITAKLQQHLVTIIAKNTVEVSVVNLTVVKPRQYSVTIIVKNTEVAINVWYLIAINSRRDIICVRRMADIHVVPIHRAISGSDQGNYARNIMNPPILLIYLRISHKSNRNLHKQKHHPDMLIFYFVYYRYG